MKKIAFYGKGGIGKSTTAANVSAAFAQMGRRVCQVGCDPKNDSTRLLLGRIAPSTILDLEREKGTVCALGDLVHEGWRGIRCIEAGGPDPGVGCAGRGIIVALEKLKALHAFDDMDVVLYDVLGDVVCGGFAVPIREGYASEIYIVSSGELMSLYAANNIAKGVYRFASRGAVRIGGIIGNGRDVKNEEDLLKAFAERIGTQLIAYMPRSRTVHEAEVHRQTLIAYAPDSEQAELYQNLARMIDENTNLAVPKPMTFEELEEMVIRYGG